MKKTLTNKTNTTDITISDLHLGSTGGQIIGSLTGDAVDNGNMTTVWVDTNSQVELDKETK